MMTRCLLILAGCMLIATMATAQDHTPLHEIRQALERGDWPRAESLLFQRRNAALREAASYAQMLGQLALVLLNYPKALSYFEDAVQWDPTNTVYKEDVEATRKKLAPSPP
jgi:tetratricopeptide (TPR) repeat protein